LHQGPTQASALEIRSQQDRVFAGLAGRVEVQPDDAERFATGFVDGDKGHGARKIKLRQAGNELMRELLDGIEEAQPQVFLAHMRQKVAHQGFVIGLDRPDKYPAAIRENKMSRPSWIGRLNGRHRNTQTHFYGCIRSVATRYFLA